MRVYPGQDFEPQTERFFLFEIFLMDFIYFLKCLSPFFKEAVAERLEALL